MPDLFFHVGWAAEHCCLGTQLALLTGTFLHSWRGTFAFGTFLVGNTAALLYWDILALLPGTLRHRCLGTFYTAPGTFLALLQAFCILASAPVWAHFLHSCLGHWNILDWEHSCTAAWERSYTVSLEPAWIHSGTLVWDILAFLSGTLIALLPGTVLHSCLEDLSNILALLQEQSCALL